MRQNTIHSRFYILLFLLLSSVTEAQSANSSIAFIAKSPYITGLKDQHAQALRLWESGQKEEAWKKLAPLAQSGDSNAMFFMGKMIIDTHDWHSRLDLAHNLLNESAARNHPLAKQAIAELKNIKTLDRMKGDLFKEMEMDPALKNQIEDARRRHQEHLQSKAQKSSTATVKIHVFVDDFSNQTHQLIQLTNMLSDRFGRIIEVTAHLRITPSAIKSKTFVNPAQGFVAPLGGYHPDLNDQKAQQYSVTEYPTLIVTGPNATKRFVGPAIIQNSVENAIRDVSR